MLMHLQHKPDCYSSSCNYNSKLTIYSPTPLKNKCADLLWNNLLQSNECGIVLTKIENAPCMMVHENPIQQYQTKFMNYDSLAFRISTIIEDREYCLRKSMKENQIKSFDNSNFQKINDLNIETPTVNIQETQVNDSVNNENIAFPPRSDNPVIHDEYFLIDSIPRIKNLLLI